MRKVTLEYDPRIGIARKIGIGAIVLTVLSVIFGQWLLAALCYIVFVIAEGVIAKDRNKPPSANGEN